MRTLRFDKSSVSFADVDQVREIDTVEIAFCNLTNLNGIENLPLLKVLRVHYCRYLTDISALSSLQHLDEVIFYSTPQLRQYDALQSSSLTAISLNGPYEIDSIRPIAELKALEYLALSRVKVVDGDYQPIVANRSLKRVFWHGAPFAPPALSEIKRLRPDLLIGGNGVHNRNHNSPNEA